MAKANSVLLKESETTKGVAEDLPPGCDSAMEMMVDLWDDHTDQVKRDALNRHLAVCVHCTQVFKDICELQMQFMGRKAAR